MINYRQNNIYFCRIHFNHITLDEGETMTLEMMMYKSGWRFISENIARGYIYVYLYVPMYL